MLVRSFDRARRAPRGVTGAVAALAALLVAGCATKPRARIHDDFSDLQPRAVEILPVKNETVYTDLDSFSTTQILQRALFGPDELNVYTTMQNQARRELERLGYTVVEDDGEGTSDAARLQIVLTRWGRRGGISTRHLEGQIEVELTGASGEPALYASDGRISTQHSLSRGERLTSGAVVEALGDAIARALRDLPPLEGTQGVAP